jgi:hypothetical protein
MTKPHQEYNFYNCQKFKKGGGGVVPGVWPPNGPPTLISSNIKRQLNNIFFLGTKR